MRPGGHSFRRAAVVLGRRLVGLGDHPV